MQWWVEALGWLEQSSLGHAIRASGVWTYALLNLAHILGIATLVGSVIILDVAMFGWPHSAALSSIATIAVPMSLIGFGLAIVSGLCMLATNGTEYAHNPFLPMKFVAIFLAATNAGFASRTTAWKKRNSKPMNDITRRERIQLRVMASISLVCWLGAVSAGRMIGYW